MSAAPAPSLELAITVVPRDGGALDINESWSVSDWNTETPFVRTVFLRGVPDRFPLHQRMSDIVATSADGVPLDWEESRYGADRVRLAFPTIPTKFTLSYRITGLRKPSDIKGEFSLQYYGLPSLKHVSIRGDVSRLGAHAFDSALEENVLERVSSTHLEGGPTIAEARLTISFEAPVAPIDTVAEIKRQLGLPLVAVVLTLLLALASLLFKPRVRANALFTGFGLTGAVGVYYFAPLAIFDAFSPQFSGLEQAVHSFSAIVVYIGLGAVLALVTGRWGYQLSRARPEAWHGAFGLPIFFAMLLWPAAEVEPAFWVVPFIAAAPLVVWWTPAVRLWSGADLHRLVEIVRAEGQIGFADLAARANLRPKRLMRLFESHPNLAVVIDREQQLVLSPASAELMNRMICGGCGGASVLTGRGLARCGYCGRNQANIEPLEPSKPIPHIAKALAELTHSVAMSVAIWVALLTVVAFPDEWLKEGFVNAVTYVVIMVVIGGACSLALEAASQAIAEGSGYTILRGLMLLGTPLIIPIFAFRALGTRRARHHFGVFKPTEIAKKLEADREVTISTLAGWLGCTEDEATDLAIYLVGNDQLDAIYDRRNARIVTREAFAELASSTSCQTCGGLRSEVAGEVICTFCGTR